MDEERFIEMFQEILEVEESDLGEDSCPLDITDHKVSTRSFEEAMVLTMDKGLVVTIDGERFFLTVQKG